MLPEAFAVVREASKRTLGMRHFDVQIIGGQVLHEGKVAEMKTGEGKTLVAHARRLRSTRCRARRPPRDRQRLPGPARRRVDGPALPFLGLRSASSSTTSTARSGAKRTTATSPTSPTTRSASTTCATTWRGSSKTWCSASCTSRSSTRSTRSSSTRRARRSSSAARATTRPTCTHKFAQTHPAAGQRRRLHRRREGARRSDHRGGRRQGREVLGITNLYDQRNLELTHQLNAALKAWHLFHNDQQYIVKDGEVVIVDEFTGRLMYGRRYSDGIHQAIEAKEGVDGSQRGPDARDDHVPELLPPVRQAGRDDRYREDRGARVPRDLRARRRRRSPRTGRARAKTWPTSSTRARTRKYEAVVDEIIAEHEKGRPVLVGTRSIEKSERLASMLRRRASSATCSTRSTTSRKPQIIKDAG